MHYSDRLGEISNGQLQAALDRFGLGTLLTTGTISAGLFGQNLFLTTTEGEFVFRGAPHYDWQLPTERHFANLLHRATTVPVPWPYLVEPESALFAWPWGYAIMPRLKGTSLADAARYEALSPAQRLRLATAMGHALSRLHAWSSPLCGTHDLASDAIRPFANGYVARTVARATELAQGAKGNGALDNDDERWLGDLLDRAAGLPEPDAYAVVHEDFNRNNLTFRIDDADVAVTGVFDLMTCHFGDGLADLPRQFCMFLDEEGGEDSARAFVQTYLSRRKGLTPADVQRAMLYLVDERLLVWEYAHRPGHEGLGWWDLSMPLRAWLQPFLDTWSKTIRA